MLACIPVEALQFAVMLSCCLHPVPGCWQLPQSPRRPSALPRRHCHSRPGARQHGQGDSAAAPPQIKAGALRWQVPAGLRGAERSLHPLAKALGNMERTLQRLLRLQQLLPAVDVATLLSKRLDLLLMVCLHCCSHALIACNHHTDCMLGLTLLKN